MRQPAQFDLPVLPPGLLAGLPPGSLPGLLAGLFPGLLPVLLAGLCPALLAGLLPGLCPALLAGLVPGLCPALLAGLPVLLPVLRTCIRLVTRSRRISLARTLILVEITRIARACPGVPEDKETESVQRYFRSSADSASQEHGHEGNHYLAQGLNLSAVRPRGRPGSAPGRWPRARACRRLGGRSGRPGLWLDGRLAAWLRFRPRGRLRDRQQPRAGEILRDVGGYPAQLR